MYNIINTYYTILCIAFDWHSYKWHSKYCVTRVGGKTNQAAYTHHEFI